MAYINGNEILFSAVVNQGTGGGVSAEYVNNNFANAIKKTVSAVNLLWITDVSPIDHIIKVRVICPEGVDPFTVSVVVDCEHGVQTHDPHGDGTLDDIQSRGCTTFSFWAGEGITVEVEYNQDTEKALQNIHINFPYADYGLPIVYFDGDITAMTKDNAVTLNYRYGERSGTCTLKWQGSSSLTYPKKNYTVKFDNAFEAKEGWGEEKKYCLKADWIDFSHCRNVCSAKLWGQIVKSRATSDLTTRLSALVNGGAIDGFPCFVVINGEWQGIYNFNIPKDGYMFGMGEGEKEAILCGSNQCDGNTFKSEAVIDKLATSTDTVAYDVEYASDTFANEDIQASLNTMIRAVMNSDGTDIDTTVSQFLDVDSAIDYYIFAVALKGLDILSKNAIFATYDGVRWFMSAYDLDCTWGVTWDGSTFLEAVDGNRYSYNSCSFYRLTGMNKLFALLYKYKKPEIIARYKQLRETILSPSYVASHFYNYAKYIPLVAYKAENELWTDIPCTSANKVEQIAQWYSERVNLLDAEIKEMDEKLEQVATEGLAYTEHGHPSFGKMYKIAGIGTATDTEIVIPKWINDAPVVEIVKEAFYSNADITSVTIPEGIQKLPIRLFANATNLKSVVIPDTITEMDFGVFYNTGLEELVIPNLVKVIPGRCASSCPNLKSVKMGNRVTEIIENGFNGSSALENIRLSENLITIGVGAFTGCTALTSISLPTNLKTISDDAFKKTSVESVTIPASVKTIGAKAFAQWWKAKEVIFKGTPDSIGANAFLEAGANVTDGVQIYVPWAEGAVSGAPWGATKATIHYNSEV